MISRHAKFDMTLNDRHKMNGGGGGFTAIIDATIVETVLMQIRSRIIQRIIVHEIKEKFNCRAPPSKFSLLSFRASRSPCPLTKGSPFHTFNSQGVSLLRVTLKLYHDNSLSLSLFFSLCFSLCLVHDVGFCVATLISQLR